MNLVARIIFAVLMLLVAGFCVVAFIATYGDNAAFNPKYQENPAFLKWMWRGMSVFLGVVSIGTAISLLRPRRVK